MSLILALDIGTSSTRALLFDAQGRKVGEAAQRPYHNDTTPDGGVETPADALLERTAQCVDEVLSRASGEIQGVGVACFWHSLLAVDKDGKALTPVYSWADNRAGAWVAPLRALLDENAAHMRTGCAFHPSYWPAKLLWLHATHPELFDGGTRWISFAEYLALHWTGEARCSLSMASGTGIFNQNACDWDAETLHVLPIERENLSTLCDANEPLPPLRLDLASRWPALKGAKWFPALGDGACSNIGSGALTPGKLALNGGTSGALRVVLKEFNNPIPQGLWRYHIDRGRVLFGGAISNVGNVLLWATRTLKLADDWDKTVMGFAPDGHGLTVLPFLAGERSPLWNPNAKFVLSGANLDTTPEEIMRACLEAVALRFAEVYYRVREVAPADEVIYSGGAFEAAHGWAQIVCDAIGVPLTQNPEPEATARGAALLAWESLGATSTADFNFERGTTLQPDMERHALYRRALERQNALYEHVSVVV